MFCFRVFLGFPRVDSVARIMSRSMLLVLMMMILVIMSHYEWRQLLVTDVDVIGESQKHQETLKSEEVIKEKVVVASLQSLSI